MQRVRRRSFLVAAVDLAADLQVDVGKVLQIYRNLTSNLYPLPDEQETASAFNGSTVFRAEFPGLRAVP